MNRKTTDGMRILLMPIFALFLICTFASCEIESSDNGALDGFWHLERVDTLATGGSSNLSDSLLFWSVQMRILNLSDKSNRYPAVNCRFSHYSDTLRVYSPYFDNRMNGDPAVTDPASLTPYGMDVLDETFLVERLTGSRMVLKSDVLRLVFKRF